MKKNPIYCVCLLGYDEEECAVDWDDTIEETDDKEHALKVAGAIHSLEDLENVAQIDVPSFVKHIQIQVEECHMDNGNLYCDDLLDSWYIL